MATALSQDEIEAELVKKGFRRSHTDHRYFILNVDGKKEAATFLSHGKNQDIGAPGSVENIDKFCCDMSPAFISGIENSFPNASITLADSMCVEAHE